MSVKLGVLNSFFRRKKFELVPHSHWQALDRDVDYIRAVDNLQSNLINYIRRPCRSIDLQPVDEDGNSILEVHIHHDALLEKLWKYLAIALIHRDDCNIDAFRIMHIQLVTQVMSQLERALRTKRLKTLFLHDNHFGWDGIVFVAEVIKANKTLTALSLNFNGMDDLDSAIQLGEALGGHPFLESLSFRHCTFGSDPMTLRAIVTACRSVKFLDLRNTDIGSEGAATVSEFLATNPLVETVNLSTNSFNALDAAVVAQGLSTNTKLRILYMSNNPVLEDGKKALLKAIFDTTSLNAAAASNHTCELIFDQPQSVHPMVMLINNFTGRDTNRKRKVVFAIHDAVVLNSNYRSLEAVPMQVGPEVLGLIQFGPLKYLSSSIMFNYSLTLTYEVMRHWLCSYLGK